VAELSGQLGYPAQHAEVCRRLTQVIASPHDAAFAALNGDGKIVGWVHVFATLRLVSEVFAELGGLVVARDQRRRGVGRLLLAHAQNWAKAQGIDKLRIRSRVNRSDAHAFYEYLGCQLTKQQRVYDRSLK
jgi:GNAT superfamily N-acetyltransferase